MDRQSSSTRSAERKLVLASGSPRRREILERAGFRFEVRVADVPENRLPDEPAIEYVRRLARAKACAVPRFPEEIVLGADTAVVVDDVVLGKPRDRSDAARMLEMLSGREHVVITGICLIGGEIVREGHAETRVCFVRLSSGEIAEYVNAGEPMDKAGAYGIQGLASKFIDRIEGCYFNVVGLPVAMVYQWLNKI